MKVGGSVALIDTKKSNPNAYLTLSVQRALERNSRVREVELLEYDDLNHRLNEKRFDLLLAIDGEQLNIPVFRQAVARVGASALWVWEDPYERPSNLRAAELFDIVLTNDSASAPFYGAKGHFLALAGTLEIRVREDDASYRYDLFFAGSAWPNRVHFLRRLLREMPELKSRIVLQYNQGVPTVPLDLPDADYVGGVSHQEFLEIANASRVTVTLNRKFSADGLRRAAASPGPRLFEIALAGGCQLVEARELETADVFETGSEIEVFEEFPDFRTKLTDLLSNPARRVGLARAAQSRARRDHNFDRRIDRLLDLVEQNSGGKRAPTIRRTREIEKPTVLFATHNSTASLQFGGVEVYQDTIVAELRKEYRILFFRMVDSPPRDGMRDYVLTDESHRVIRSFLVPDFDVWSTLSHPPLEEVFGLVLSTYDIDLIHFHHLINLCPSLPITSRMIGIPSVFTHQDFWTICKKFNLLQYDGKYCDIARRPKTACDVCLNITDGIPPDAQHFRREFFQHALQAMSAIIFNTTHTTKVFKAIYPDIDIRNAPIIGLPTPLGAPRRSTGDSDRRGGRDVEEVQRLRVVFLGNFTTHKGADIFLDAVSVLSEDPIDFTVCGRVNEPQNARLKDPRYADIRVEGQFQPGDLDLSRFDVALHLSIWPETYCITLSEAWQAGLVPIVTDCGALGDRVTDTVDGLKIPIADAGALVSALRRLLDRGERERIASNIGPHLWLTPAQHVSVLREIYAKVRAAEPVSHTGGGRDGESRGPTLASSRLAPLPHRWTVPGMGPPIPLLGHDLTLRSPMSAQASEIGGALREGATRPLALGWTLDQVIGDIVTLGGWKRRVAKGAHPPDTIHFKGWLKSSDGRASNVYFGLRSGEGDLFILSHKFEPRPDVVAALGQPADGFATEPFATEILDRGVYALEIFQVLASGEVGVAALPIVVHVGDKVTNLLTSRSDSSTSDQEYPRVPVGMKPRLAPSAPTDEPPVDLCVEKLDILNKQPSLRPDLWLLEVGGWLVAPTRDVTKPISLHMTGVRYYRAEVFYLERPDVSAALGHPIDEVCGFAGSVFLSALEAGQYKLFLSYVDAGMEVMVHIGNLDMGIAPTSAIVGR